MESSIRFQGGAAAVFSAYVLWGSRFAIVEYLVSNKPFSCII